MAAGAQSPVLGKFCLEFFLSCTMVVGLFSVLTSALVLNAPLQSCSSSRCVSRSATSSIQMINLFGNTGQQRA